ncbi:unnamed protein product [Caenorhabditis brenneri]
MNSKPMSYDSLRTLLPYLEANKRIELVSRVPSLRSMEKRVPFNIDYLKYDPDSTTINGTEYKVGVIRHYGGDQTAKIHKDMKSDQSGAFERQDKFLQGFLKNFQFLDPDGNFKSKKAKVAYYKFLKDYTTGESSSRKKHPNDKSAPWKNELTKLLDFYRSYPRHDAPGHIKDQNKRGGFAHDFDEYGFKILDSLRTGEPGDEQELNDLEREYEKTKQLYMDTEKLYMMDSTGLNFKNEDKMMECYNYLWQHTQKEQDDYIKELLKLEKRLADLKTLVEMFLDDIQPFYNRKYNIPLEYTPYIQLSVNGKATEVVKYNKQLHCALRHVSLFNRKDPVKINILAVNQELRVPPGLKFKVRELRLLGNLFLICDSLKPLIDDSSYPIEEIVVMKTADNGYHHETIRTARELSISCPVSLPNLLVLQNKTVEIETGRISVEDYIELVESWMNNRKEIGTAWTFDVRYLRTLTRLMNAIPHGNMVGATERYIPLPLTHSAVLHISYHHKPTLYDKDRWILKMVIENV